MAELTADKRKRALTIAVIISILFGAYFLRHYFSVIIFAAISALLFNPVYSWFLRRGRRAGAAPLTLLVAALTFLIPVAVILVFTVMQVNSLISDLQHAHSINWDNLDQNILNFINRILADIPGAHQLTIDQVTSWVEKAVVGLATGMLNLIISSISGIGSFITSLIIYIYVFLNFLTHRDSLISAIKKLNPLGESMTDLYLEKIAEMTIAMTRGQFVVAVCQGFVDALILAIAGIHSVFFFLFVLLSVLSIIPLGGGIIVIPIGIVMILLGNVWGGLFVLAAHFLIVTNIDNLLRPRLVPKRIRLNPALTLLAVFSGIAMFGFLGIVVGPVLMIVMKLTIEAYIDPSSISRDSSPKKAAS